MGIPRWTGRIKRPDDGGSAGPRREAPGYSGDAEATVALLVGNVPWPGDEGDPSEALAERLDVSPDAITEVTLIKKSLDARQREPVWFALYRVEVAKEDEVLARGAPSVRRWTDKDDRRYGLVDDVAVPRVFGDLRPIVVGAGPAGLFAALYLAESGARVLLLERGEPVEARVRTVNDNWRG